MTTIDLTQATNASNMFLIHLLGESFINKTYFL